jgi:hypothetical protein
MKTDLEEGLKIISHLGGGGGTKGPFFGVGLAIRYKIFF